MVESFGRERPNGFAVDVNVELGTDIKNGQLMPLAKFNRGFDDRLLGGKKLGEFRFPCFVEIYVLAFRSNVEIKDAGLVVLDGHLVRLHNDSGMLLDGHSATSIAERLGISGTNLLYR